MYLKIFLVALTSIIIGAYIYHFRKRKSQSPSNNSYILPLKFVDGVPIKQDIFEMYIRNTISILKSCLAYSKAECDLLDDKSFIDEVIGGTKFGPLTTENGPGTLLKSLAYTICKREKLNFNSPLTKVSPIISQLFLYEKNNEMFALPFTESFFNKNITSNISKQGLMMTNFVIIFKNIVSVKEIDFNDVNNSVYLNYFLCSLYVYKPNVMYDWLYVKDGWYSSDGIRRDLSEYEDCFVGFCVFGR